MKPNWGQWYIIEISVSSLLWLSSFSLVVQTLILCPWSPQDMIGFQKQYLFHAISISNSSWTSYVLWWSRWTICWVQLEFVTFVHLVTTLNLHSIHSPIHLFHDLWYHMHLCIQMIQSYLTILRNTSGKEEDLKLSTKELPWGALSLKKDHLVLLFFFTIGNFYPEA